MDRLIHRMSSCFKLACLELALNSLWPRPLQPAGAMFSKRKASSSPGAPKSRARGSPAPSERDNASGESLPMAKRMQRIRAGRAAAIAKCAKGCHVCLVQADISNWPHANLDGKLCNIDGAVKRVKYDDIGQSTFINMTHAISVESYNFWKWRSEYVEQSTSGGTVKLRRQWWWACKSCQWGCACLACSMLLSIVHLTHPPPRSVFSASRVGFLQQLGFWVGLHSQCSFA